MGVEMFDQRLQRDGSVRIVPRALAFEVDRRGVRFDEGLDGVADPHERDDGDAGVQLGG